MIQQDMDNVLEVEAKPVFDDIKKTKRKDRQESNTYG